MDLRAGSGEDVEVVELWADKKASMMLYAAASILTIIAVFVLTLPLQNSAQAQTAGGSDIQFAWAQQFGSDANDGARSVAVGSEGIAYTAGYTGGSLEGTSFGGSDAFVGKHRANDGGPGWIRQFGSPSSDDAFDVAADQQGNVYVSGSGNPLNRSTSGGFIRKYDQDGNTSSAFTGPTWTKQFNGGRIQTFAADPEGNVYVSLNTGQDVFVYKYGPNGELLASEPFGAFCNLNDFAFGSAARGSSDASVYITGITSGQIDDAGRNCNVSPGITNSEDSLFLIKFDGALNKEWHEQFGAEMGTSTAIDVAVDSDDKAYVAGYTSGRVLDDSLAGTGAGEPQRSFGNTDSFLFKFDDGAFGNGAMVYAKQFGTSGHDRARGVTMGAGSVVHVAGNTDGSFDGTTRNPNPGTSDVFVSKRGTADGQELVTRRFGGSGNDFVNGVAYHESSEGLVLAGSTDGALFNEQNVGGSDAYVAKIGPTDLDVDLETPARLETRRFNELAGNPFTAGTTVRNTGTGTMTNISVQFSSSPAGLAVEGSNTREIDSLEPGQSKTVSFTVRAAEPRAAQEYETEVTASSGADTGLDRTLVSVPASGYSYVALGDSSTTGHGVETCSDTEESDNAGFEFRYGCRSVEEGGVAPKAEPWAERVAHDPHPEGLGAPFDDLNRVGVWGYTARNAVEAYAVGTGYRDGTTYQSQLHAVEGARDLVTVSLGVNDMDFGDVEYWYGAYFNPFVSVESAANTRYSEQAETPIGAMFDEHLAPARERGVDVYATLYMNTISSTNPDYGCKVNHQIAEQITGRVNAGLTTKANEHDIGLISFYDLWNRDGKDHGTGAYGASAEPWSYGDGCDVDDLIYGALPDVLDLSDYEFDPAYEIGAQQTIDPHPNDAGSEAMADEVVRVVEEGSTTP